MFAVKLNRLSSPDHHSFVESPGSRSRRHNIDIKFPSYSISIINHGDVERETRFERRGEEGEEEGEEGEKEKNGTCCAIDGMFRDRGNRFELNRIDRLLTDHLKGGSIEFRD